jgi:hypothetical protein
VLQHELIRVDDEPGPGRFRVAEVPAMGEKGLEQGITVGTGR